MNWVGKGRQGGGEASLLADDFGLQILATSAPKWTPQWYVTQGRCLVNMHALSFRAMFGSWSLS